MILHIHKNSTVELNLKDIANEFIEYSEHKLKIFSKINIAVISFIYNSLIMVTTK